MYKKTIADRPLVVNHKKIQVGEKRFENNTTTDDDTMVQNNNSSSSKKKDDDTITIR